MKILLISPASGKWHKIGKRKLFDGKTFRFSMLSLLTVAKLTPQDAQIKIIDEQLESIPEDDKFDLVGITCMTATAPRAFEISKYFRAKGVPVVLGGFYPSLNKDVALEHADAVVVGPAFDAWPKLIHDIKNKQLERVYNGNPAGKVPARLPRQLINSDKYATVNATYATAGCTNKCKFCSISAFYKTNRYHRPVEEVIAEIASFDKRFFMFIDDNLTQDKEYAAALFKELIPLKKKWITQASIELADDDKFLGLMHEAGCVGVFVGLETFNQKNLKKQTKTFNAPQKYKKAVKRLHRHGIFVEAGIIFGFDDDDVNVFNSTLDMLEDIGIDAIQASILTPLPGTELFEQMRHRITDHNLQSYDYRHVVYNPARISAANLQAGADWFIRKYYSPLRIFKRFLRWITVPHGLSNFIYPLILNLGYYGRTKSFNIRGYEPSKKHLKSTYSVLFRTEQSYLVKI
jgi:radical SAM superfamily enzyme YgiQ (UPF0313 family)